MLLGNIVTMRLLPDGNDICVACKRDGWRNVDIFKMSDPSDYRPIRFEKYKEDVSLKAKISKDLQTVYLNTGKESILLRGEKQDILRWFNVKQAVKIASYQEGFLCLTVNDYDVEIDILHTNKPDFKYHIPRKQTPGLNKFLDIKVTDNLVKISSMRDEEFFIDIYDVKNDKIVMSSR